MRRPVTWPGRGKKSAGGDGDMPRRAVQDQGHLAGTGGGFAAAAAVQGDAVQGGGVHPHTGKVHIDLSRDGSDFALAGQSAGQCAVPGGGGYFQCSQGTLNLYIP